MKGKLIILFKRQTQVEKTSMFAAISKLCNNVCFLLILELIANIFPGRIYSTKKKQ